MITQERLKTLLNYDPETGLFIRLVSHRIDRVGKNPGTLNTNGYVQMRVDGKRYLAHRLAWLFQYGSWPIDQIDHINGVRTDNRIENLRAVTNKQNCENKRLSAKNTTGFRGVSFDKSREKYRATIGHRMEQSHIGLFDTLEQAASAAKAARDELFTHHHTSYSS